LIREEKKRAGGNGEKAIVVDAGDFSMGTLFTGSELKGLLEVETTVGVHQGA